LASATPRRANQGLIGNPRLSQHWLREYAAGRPSATTLLQNPPSRGLAGSEPSDGGTSEAASFFFFLFFFSGA
jgi:hypothetical protein